MHSLSVLLLSLDRQRHAGAGDGGTAGGATRQDRRAGDDDVRPPPSPRRRQTRQRRDCRRARTIRHVRELGDRAQQLGRDRLHRDVADDAFVARRPDADRRRSCEPALSSDPDLRGAARQSNSSRSSPTNCSMRSRSRRRRTCATSSRSSRSISAIGHGPRGQHKYDTIAAQNAGRQVRTELIG